MRLAAARHARLGPPGRRLAAICAVTLAASAGPAPAAGDPALGYYLSSECAACHQPSGRQAGGIPAITGLPADRFVALMQEYRGGQRDNQTMRLVAGRLTPDEIEALAAYYAVLPRGK